MLADFRNTSASKGPEWRSRMPLIIFAMVVGALTVTVIVLGVLLSNAKKEKDSIGTIDCHSFPTTEKRESRFNFSKR